MAPHYCSLSAKSLCKVLATMNVLVIAGMFGTTFLSDVRNTRPASLRLFTMTEFDNELPWKRNPEPNDTFIQLVNPGQKRINFLNNLHTFIGCPSQPACLFTATPELDLDDDLAVIFSKYSDIQTSSNGHGTEREFKGGPRQLLTMPDMHLRRRTEGWTLTEHIQGLASVTRYFMANTNGLEPSQAQLLFKSVAESNKNIYLGGNSILKANGSLLSHHTCIASWINQEDSRYTERSEVAMNKIEEQITLRTVTWSSCNKQTTESDCQLSFSNTVPKISQCKFTIIYGHNNTSLLVTHMALLAGSVPVMLDSKAEEWLQTAPQKSVIQLHDFEGAKELAMYLMRLNSDIVQYAAYHQWRTHFSYLGMEVKRDVENLCTVCNHASSQLKYRMPLQSVKRPLQRSGSEQPVDLSLPKPSSESSSILMSKLPSLHATGVFKLEPATTAAVLPTAVKEATATTTKQTKKIFLSSRIPQKYLLPKLTESSVKSLSSGTHFRSEQMKLRLPKATEAMTPHLLTWKRKKAGQALILLWTRLDSVDWKSILRYNRSTCAHQCSFTRDRTRLGEATLVVLTGWGTCSTNLHNGSRTCVEFGSRFSFPPFRPQNQEWLYYNKESQLRTANGNELLFAQHFFNYTMTFKSDSDIWDPYGYTKIHRAPELLQNKTYKYAKTKIGLVAWYVSNCQGSRRNSYVKELKKYVHVDIFGKCGISDGCGKNKTCSFLNGRKYKFYLAFENSLCKDYMTEKFWSSLSRMNVPVVLGASYEDYERVAPPHSFIHTENFTSPRKLADYLISLNENDTAYNEYHKWRQSYTFQNPHSSTSVFSEIQHYKACTLCELATVKPRKTVDISKFWNKNTDCDIE